MKISNSFFDYKKSFILLCIFISILFPVLSFDFGITEDEQAHSQHGKNILDFFLHKSDKAIRSPIDSVGNLQPISFDENMDDLSGEMNIYGGAFDLLCAIADKFFSFGEFESRHFINSLFGVLLIVFSGLCAQWIAGWRAAIITLLLLSLSPRIIGHSMNNPKDLPFAALYMFNMFFIFRFVYELPKLKIKTWFPLLIGIPFAADIRILGLLLIIFLIAFVFLRWGIIWIEKKMNQEELKKFFYSLLITLFFSAGAYLLTSVLWPFAHTNPILIPLRAFQLLSRFDIFNSLELFDGKWINRWEVPWYFIPKWFLIGSPVFIPLGIAASFLFLKKYFSKISRKKILFITSAFFIPISLGILRNSYTYDDARHVLFTYPPLIIFCSIAFENIFRLDLKKYFRIGFILLITLSMIEPLRWMIKNHPNENVYFTPLIGGVNGAWKKYETDYWGNSVRQAVEWIQVNAKPKQNNSVKIRIWYGDQMKAKYYINQREGFQYVLVPENSPDWDYYILETVQCKFTPDVLFNWPPAGTVHEIKADNTPLCAIIKNPLPKFFSNNLDTYDDYLNLSLRFYQEGKFEESIQAAKHALEKNPNSAAAYNNLCAAYNSLQRWEEAKNACEKAISLQPDFQLAKNNLKWATDNMKE